MRIITPPTTEPVSLDEACIHLKDVYPEDFYLVSAQISAAREQAEAFTRRYIAVQTVELAMSKFPTRIKLPLPVVSITSLKYIDPDGVEQTITDYQFSNQKDDAYIIAPYGRQWPATKDIPEAVMVRFVVGYTTCPQSIRAAILLMVGDLYANRESIAFGVTVNEIPLTAERLLSVFRDYREV
jgi:uncharacterized phiE125 gp8 family phage protein